MGFRPSNFAMKTLRAELSRHDDYDTNWMFHFKIEIVTTTLI